MKRSITTIPLLLLTAALLSPAGAATAAPPGDGSFTDIKAAGDACSFAIRVDVTGKAKTIPLPHNPKFFQIVTAPAQRVTVTNLENGKSVTAGITGVLRYTGSSGGVDSAVASGNNFFYGEPQNPVRVTAFLTTGPVKLTAQNNHLTSLDTSGARVRDICAELA
jgi:hypothetical protein